MHRVCVAQVHVAHLPETINIYLVNVARPWGAGTPQPSRLPQARDHSVVVWIPKQEDLSLSDGSGPINC